MWHENIELCCDWLNLKGREFEVVGTHGGYSDTQISKMENITNIELDSSYIRELCIFVSVTICFYTIRE